MNYIKGFLGYVLFVAGLLLAIAHTSEQYNNIWWHLIGYGLLGYGLDLIIEDKIDTAKREMSREIDERLSERD